MNLKNKTYRNITITSIITVILLTSGIGVAYAADTEHVGTLEVGSPTNIASGDYSAAFGYSTEASAEKAVAFGDGTTASGSHSAAFGGYTTASGHRSVSFGTLTTASGSHSAAFGYSTTAQPYSSFVIGKHNEISGTKTSWITTEPLFVIGNGADASNLNNAVTVLKNGNVGIGVSAPSEKLHISDQDVNGYTGFRLENPGQSNMELRTYGDSSSAWRGASIISSWNTDVDLGLVADSLGKVNAGTSDHVIWLDASSGNVGIGTTNPQESLEIFSRSNPVLSLHDSSTATFKLGIDESAKVFKLAAMDGGYGGHIGSFANNDDNVLSMDINGNVGIGTTSPSEKLEVAGIIYSTTGGFKFPDGTTQTTASIDTILDGTTQTTASIDTILNQTDIEAFGFVTGSHTIDTDTVLWTENGNDLSYTTGNVGIGTTNPNNNTKLDVVGNIGLSGNIIATAGQDICIGNCPS